MECEDDGTSKAHPVPSSTEGEVHMDDDTEIDPHNNIAPVATPSPNLVFDTLQKLEKHLSDFARASGFAIRIRTVKPPRNSNQPPKHIIWVCNKGGEFKSKAKNKMKPRVSQKVKCPARFNAKEKDGCWQYTLVCLDHNHPLDPEDSRFLRAYRGIETQAENRIWTNDRAGIKPSRSYMAEVIRKRGFQNVRYLERDVRNLLQRKRQKVMCGPDSVAMYHYFLRCVRESDRFYFMMDLSRDGRLLNVMWVDARSRAAYDDFNDVVGFDTTYLKNKYEMPFAPFVGVNHHGQSILLGCALLSREDEESFRWLFKTWLDCMGGKAPGGIVTDQSVPITKAIELEMPNTRHRWCLWHIMEKQHKKFFKYKDSADIKKAMSALVYDTMTKKEFKDGWSDFIKKYGLQKNTWLSTLYRHRKRWVPTLVNNFFWAGMSTTQRNERVNCFFKGYVNKKTSLRQFVLQYDLALASKCERERLSDHSSRHTRYDVVTKFIVEKAFQPVYTHDIFDRLMDEVRGCLYMTLILSKETDKYREYEVEDNREYGDPLIEKQVRYNVRLEKGNNHVCCSCKLFEMRGIMCRHSIKVYYHAGVEQVPDIYFLRRWRKDVHRPYTRVKVPYYEPEKSESVIRYEKMQEFFDKVATRAMDSVEETNIVMEGIKSMTLELDKCNTTSKGPSLITQTTSQNEDQQGDVLFLIESVNGAPTLVQLQDPNDVRAAGRPSVQVRRNKPKRKPTNSNKSGRKGSCKISTNDEEPQVSKQSKKQRKRKSHSATSPQDDDMEERDNTDHVGPSNHQSDQGVTQDVRQLPSTQYDEMMEMFDQFSQQEVEH